MTTIEIMGLMSISADIKRRKFNAKLRLLLLAIFLAATITLFFFPAV